MKKWKKKSDFKVFAHFTIKLRTFLLQRPVITPWRCHSSAYFHFHREGRHVGIFSTTHDHLLQRVPFIVAADRALILLHGPSNTFLFNCSCSTWCALGQPLHPAGHCPAKLGMEQNKKKRKSFLIIKNILNNIFKNIYILIDLFMWCICKRSFRSSTLTFDMNKTVM